MNKSGTGLPRELRVFPLTMVAVGACIGSGIFLTPSEIARYVASEEGILLAWLIGGLVALSGSLTFAELGARLPGEGGVYEYLRKAYGELVAFLYGWIILTVITSGAIAALALACARYVGYLFPMGSAAETVLAIGLILMVTVVQTRGLRTGAGFSTFLTVIKIVGIALLILAGAWYWSTEESVPQVATRDMTSGGLALALVGVFWSYGGWHHASYLAGEAVKPQVTVPRAMFLGAALVTLVYLGANWAYLQVMHPGEMAESNAVAAEMLGRLHPSGGTWIAVLIIISTLGTASIYTLSAPRIYFTMASKGTFFPFLAKVHPEFRTPSNAILLQSGWAIVLLLFWATFDNLITYVVFMDWVFMLMAGFALFLFRKREGTEGLVYKTPLFPLMPVIFIGLSAWFLVSTLIQRPEQAWAGIALCLTGVPVFLFFRKYRSRAQA